MESVGHWRQEFAYHRPRPESLVKEEETGEGKTLKTELLSAQGLNWAAKYRSIQFWRPWDEREQSDISEFQGSCFRASWLGTPDFFLGLRMLQQFES